MPAEPLTAYCAVLSDHVGPAAPWQWHKDADGKRMIAADYSGKVFVWERETGRLVKEWQAHEYGVSRCPFPPTARCF